MYICIINKGGLMIKNFIHRKDTLERHHYIPSKTAMILLHPQLVYTGLLTRSAKWKETVHIHNFLEIAFIKSGMGSITIDNQINRVRKGDIIIYNQRVPHEEKSDVTNPMEIYFFAVKNIKLKDLPENCLIHTKSNNILASKKSYKLLEYYFENLINESKKEQYFEKEITESIVKIIILSILRIFTNNGEQYVLANKSYLKAKTYIDKNYININNITKICQRIKINKYYLSHLFKQYNSKSPLKYITAKKIDLAKTLLKNSDLLIHRIALRCGYSDYTYFCKIFKNLEQTTPSQYRQNYR
jgi:AraC-like DNA-binding protein/mannose-6-phosphate isomerase-like protein (cupin superfamily)